MTGDASDDFEKDYWQSSEGSPDLSSAGSPDMSLSTSWKISIVEIHLKTKSEDHIFFFHTQYLIHIEIYLNTFANISWKIGRQFQGLSDLKNTEDMS